MVLGDKIVFCHQALRAVRKTPLSETARFPEMSDCKLGR